MPKTRINYKYTTIQRLRDEGLSSGDLNDTKADRLIRLYSDRINRWTSQYFFPVKETIRIDGTGLEGIWRPDKMPILEVDTLTVDVLGSNPSQGTVVPPEDFEIVIPGAYDSPGRVLQLRVTGGFIRFINKTRFLRFPTIGRFPKGPKNIEIIGTFGWVSEKEKVSTTTTAELAAKAKNVVVTDISKFDVGDAIRIGNDDPFVYALISKIDDATKTITFDDIGRIPASLVSGVSVVTFGNIPEAIQYACTRLVIEFHPLMTSEDFESALGQSSLTGEKIGDYSYTMQQPKYKNASATGLRDIDSILQDYVAPNFPIFVL